MNEDRERNLLGRLPPAARSKLARFIADRDRYGAAARERSSKRNDLRREIERVELSIQRMMEGPNRPHESENIITWPREQVANMRAELNDLAAADTEEQPLREALNEIVDRAFDKIGAAPRDMQIVARRPITAQPAKGETFSGAIDKCRKRIGALRAKRDEIEAAPLHSSVAIERAVRDIELLAERGRPEVGGLFNDRGAGIAWPQTPDRLLNDDGTIVGTDALAVFAWVHRKALIEALTAEIKLIAEDEIAVTPAERREAIAQIEADMASTETEEVSFIEQVANTGVAIPYRADTDPFALLGIKLKPGITKPEEPYRSKALETITTVGPMIGVDAVTISASA